ncbi:MAG: hypothetical protein R3C71_02020 [Candidatus Krumholzibacteriia bacterium]
MRVGAAAILVALAVLQPSTPCRAASPGWESAGAVLAAGGQVGWLPSPGRGCRGFTAEAVFGPGSVRQFSSTLAEQRLGLCLRFHRSVVRKWVNWKGAEICVRRGFGTRPDLTPFLELGVGELRVEDERAGAGRGTWNAVIGGGVLRRLGERWTVQLAAHARSVETGGESYSHAAVTLTLGGRIDA